ncbi:hypothetical protein TSUD_35470 [Trifolium subterraneum]|uniref:F-box associated domain-containing protein n=1 Tax=Trifolium subterraneum TaxID=3900 RepID=A0A2Z6N3Z5_TRISU|nr:hypothetical protein TSUD_35470 [Trifolium subterraneum]
MNFRRHLPHRVVLGNKIFVFGGAIRDSPAVAEVYQIVGCGASSDDKWEKLTFPCGGRFNPRIKPVSDPSNNHRLIACFGDSLYAYYPKIEKWELLHQPLDGKDLFDAFSAIMVDQVVLRSLMLGFNSCQRRFMAYNIFTNKWLIVDDSNFVYKTYFGASKIYFGDRSELFHLGNDILCLADSYTTDRKTVLRFLRFSIKLVNEELVQLTPLSFHTIDMDDIDCFAITFSPF